MKSLHLGLAAVGMFALLGSVNTASASMIGTLQVANCSGDGVIVTISSIDWLPAFGGTGCIETGSGTNITGTSTLGPGVTGSILDLSPGGGAVGGFMVFGSINFTLFGFGSGVTNTVCSTSFNPNNPACSVIAGTPFILAPTFTGTTISLPALGTVTDGSVPDSSWAGAFTTQISGRTPAQIQSTILSGGFVRATYSGDFTLVPIPEPATTALIGLGLLGLAAFRRRHSPRA